MQEKYIDFQLSQKLHYTQLLLHTHKHKNNPGIYQIKKSGPCMGVLNT